MAKKSSVLARAKLQIATLTGQNNNLKEVNDGLQMRLQAYEAKINGQAKNLELTKKQGHVAQCKVEAWKEIAHELLEELREDAVAVSGQDGTGDDSDGE